MPLAVSLSDLLQRLDKVKPDGKGGHWALCPCHPDKNPSLSITEKDGKILAHCFSCRASLPDVLDVLGLSEMQTGSSQTVQQNVKEAVYSYAGGKLRKLKYRRPDGSKYCTWQHKDGNRWSKGRKNIAPGLYQSRHELPDTLFLVEGEKDADNLEKADVPAVSLPDGAQSKWEPSYSETLKGKSIIILPDNDRPGRTYAEMCAKNLHGVAAAVWILDLKQAWPEIPDKGDISDLLFHFGVDTGFQIVMDLAQNTPKWTPAAEAPEEPAPLSLICADSVEYVPPRWLIEPYFQRGKGTLIQADPGTGKTAFMCAIAAHVSTGKPFLDTPVQTPGAVLMLSVEDDLGVLRGRIARNGGDLKKVFFMPNASEMTFNSPEIEQAIKQIGAKLLIFDPLQAFLGAKIDMFRANETRPALAKLFEMCDRHDCACAIIAHMGKSNLGKSPVNQSLGSVDIPAAMRSVLHITKNPEVENELLAVHVKSSNAPKGQSIAYSIVDRGGVEWHGFSDFSADDLNIAKKRTEKGIPYDREPLVQVFNQLIADRPGGGFWPYEEVKAAGAKLLGFPPFASTTELRSKLAGSLSRELQTKDGLIVTVGHKQKGIRGIRIEQYQHPEAYQTRIAE